MVIWKYLKKPEVGVKYIIGGDTSEGLAWGDAQVLYVVNCKTEECDAIYKKSGGTGRISYRSL